MLSKKKFLQSCKLYLILDSDVNTRDKLFEIVKQAVPAGVDIVQLRAKNLTVQEIVNVAKRIKSLIRGRVPFIVNDRVDIALAVGADGVHLGQEDLPIVEARKMVKSNFIIGTSAQTLEHVRVAQKKGADYIGFGSVFKTLTKPQRQPMNLKLLKAVTRSAQVPVFPIGGISLKNINHVVDAGHDRVAVCRDICCSRNVSQRVKKIKSILTH